MDTPKNPIHLLPPPRLDRSRQAAPQVLEYLRDRIIALDLPPGTVLSRAELASLFGLSQTPVRDALIQLAEEGLVDVYAQHKTVVGRIDTRAALQAQFLRLSVELEVVRVLTAQPNEPLAKALRSIIERQAVALKSGDYAAFVADDHAFHREMYLAGGVDPLFELVRRQGTQIDRLRRLHVPEPGKGMAVLADHEQIVDAIARGDSEAAQACVRRHLSGTLSWLHMARAKFPSYVVE